MTKTAIEWTEQTWNPVAGCSWASPGCDHCYAATMTRRLEAMGQTAYAGLTTHKHFNGVLRPLPDKLDVPLRRRKPTMWFVNSMSDLFHKDVPAAFVAEVFATMYNAQWHTFQILTKRPERMQDLLTNARLPWSIGAIVYDRLKRDEPEKAAILSAAEITQDVMDCWPLPNVWLGTSVESQEWADKRIPHLLRTPATVRFLSAEPLLGAVDLSKYLQLGRCKSIGPAPEKFRCGLPEGHQDVHPHSALIPTGSPWFSLRELHWVIAGGESGPGARPMHPDWARGLRDQCQAARVPFFFKQWGEWIAGDHVDNLPDHEPYEPSRICKLALDGTEANSVTMPYDKRAGMKTVCRVGKKAAGRLLDGREWNEMPRAVQRGEGRWP